MNMEQTLNPLQGSNFQIDLERQEVNFVDMTGVEHILSFSKVVEMLFYLVDREKSIRYQINELSPRNFLQLMTKKDGFYIGVCSDRRLSKVSEEDWQRVRANVERVTRSNWLYDYKEKHYHKVDVEYFDNSHKPKPELGADTPEQYTEADAPDFLLQEALRQTLNPDWWFNRAENMTPHTFIPIG